MPTLKDALTRGLKRSVELQTVLNQSQPTVSRALRALGDELVIIGKGRSTRYGLAKALFGLTHKQSLFSVNSQGVLSEIGEIRALASGEYLVDTDENNWWLLGQQGNGLYDDLPYFIYDLRPSGFIGRHIARSLEHEGYPADPRRWNDAQIGHYLFEYGIDLPGNLVFGEKLALRVNSLSYASDRERSSSYLDQINAIEKGERAGSSAAGEQPKFIAYDNKQGHLIVKYSPATSTPIADRIRDLLRAEYWALNALNALGVQVANCDLFTLNTKEGSRLCLESQRFDRIGTRGRRHSLSLSMIDAEFVGEGLSWSKVAQKLHQHQLITSSDLEKIIIAETFGSWIGNTDMHLGNLSLTPKDSYFSLLPIYDMLPMCFYPHDQSLSVRKITPPLKTKDNAFCWEETRVVARRYFREIAEKKTFSPDFRDLVAGLLT